MIRSIWKSENSAIYACCQSLWSVCDIQDRSRACEKHLLPNINRNDVIRLRQIKAEYVQAALRVDHQGLWVREILIYSKTAT